MKWSFVRLAFAAVLAGASFLPFAAETYAQAGMGKGMMDTMQKGSATDRMDAHIKGMEAMVEAARTVK